MERKNINEIEVQEIIKDFQLEPRHGLVIITLNSEQADGGLILSDNVMSEVQYVIAVGSHVHDLKPGQKVVVDLEKLSVRTSSQYDTTQTTSQIKIDPVFVNGQMFGYIDNRSIKSIYKY